MLEKSIVRDMYTPEDADDLREIVQLYNALPPIRKAIELGRLQMYAEMTAGIDPTPPNRPSAPAQRVAAI